ncbi:hypothetical protein [Sphingobium olei]|uniref:Tip attachment protein J domain-containing protein n=1 Tax=Sphingobium olei TaxID=420955 RepID=A0ABW3NW10_9SPHN
MLKRLDFSEFLPDRPLSLAWAKNVYPMAEGYRPVRAFQNITPALAGILGGAAFVGSDGTSALLAGTATDLYRYSGSAWTSLLGSLTATIWRFDQFNDAVIGVNGGAPVKFDLIGGTASPLGGTPPVSDLVATVRQQVFLAGDPTQKNVVYISGFEDPEQWTPGTNQSLSVAFPNGGEIMGLAGGETGIIIQKRSVRRATYTGDVTVWQFDEISREIGCMAKGSVASAGQSVFFLSEQGFMACDRNSVIPIGREKVDRTFFNLYSRDDIQNIRAAIDPRSTTVCWSMPGTPGRIWCYDWTLSKWTVIEQDLSLVFSGFTANISIDALDAIYPGGIDTIPYSLDAAIFAGGNPLFLVATDLGVVGALTGDPMAVQFTINPIEVEPGRRVRIRGARVVSDAVQGVVAVDVRARAGDSPKVRNSGAIRDNGRVPLRGNGRHVGVEVDIPSHSWTYALGVDLEYEMEGER